VVKDVVAELVEVSSALWNSGLRNAVLKRAAFEEVAAAMSIPAENQHKIMALRLRVKLGARNVANETFRTKSEADFWKNMFRSISYVIFSLNRVSSG
jgi:hypothetical protein